jgi:pantoate--beta-alanine ligase
MAVQKTMKIVESIAAFRAERAALVGTIGFVPTMGYLHEGHVSLMRQAAAENDHVVVSIFVNPTQFGANEDFSAYPRDIDHDVSVLRDAGVDLLFTPPVSEIYPKNFQTYVDVTQISTMLEGAHRPGHFRGVATVVAKLFNIVQADRAYFGEKDAQQVRVIRRMAEDLAFPVEVCIVPTVRAPDGLALSSRNVYLTPEQRLAAPVLYHAMEAVKAEYMAGERSPDVLRARALAVLHTEPHTQVEYVSLADSETLVELHTPIIDPALLSMAVKIGRARLIDNVTLE